MNEEAGSDLGNREADAAGESGDAGRWGRLASLRNLAPYLVLLYVLVAGVTWAAVTPPGGVPDEPAHLVYATAVVRNDFGKPMAVDDPPSGALMSHVVPAWVVSVYHVCYAFDPDATADCQPPVIDSGQAVVGLTSVSRYPPVYYWVVGLPSLGLVGAEALYAMRVASAILATVLVGLGLVTASPGRRWWLSVGVLVAFTPMAAFLAGSVNPNGAEIAAAIGLGVAVLGLTGDSPTGKRVWSQGAAIAVLGSYIAWARPSTWIILGAVTGASLLLNRRSVVDWIRIKPPVAITTGAVIGISVLATVPYELLVRDPVEEALAVGRGSFSATLLENLDSTLGYWTSWMMDAVGRLGWLDHTVPQMLQTLWLIALGTLLVMALAVGKRADRLLLLAILIGSTVVAPLFVLQFVFGSVVGYQARYHLSLVILVALSSVFVLGLRWRSSFRSMVSPFFGWIGILFPIIMVVAVLGSLSRYAVGQPLVWSNIFLFRFVREAAWLPPTKALVVLAIGLASLLMLAPLLRRVGIDATMVAFEDGDGTE